MTARRLLLILPILVTMVAVSCGGADHAAFAGRHLRSHATGGRGRDAQVGQGHEE